MGRKRTTLKKKKMKITLGFLEHQTVQMNKSKYIWWLKTRKLQLQAEVEEKSWSPAHGIHSFNVRGKGKSHEH